MKIQTIKSSLKLAWNAAWKAWDTNFIASIAAGRHVQCHRNLEGTQDDINLRTTCQTFKVLPLDQRPGAGYLHYRTSKSICVTWNICTSLSWWHVLYISPDICPHFANAISERICSNIEKIPAWYYRQRLWYLWNTDRKLLLVCK